jgi:hypothetical protein
MIPLKSPVTSFTFQIWLVSLVDQFCFVGIFPNFSQCYSAVESEEDTKRKSQFLNDHPRLVTKEYDLKKIYTIFSSQFRIKYDSSFVYEKSKKKIKTELVQISIICKSVFPLGSYLICFKEDLNCSLTISSLRSNLLELEIPQPSELQMYKSPRWQDYKSREM